MKFNYNAHFEITSSEVKDFVLNLAEGFIKVQEWKTKSEREQKKLDHRMKPIIKEFKAGAKRDIDRLDANRKRDMDAFNKRHQKNLKDIRAFSDRIDKKIKFIEAKCNNKKNDDIDINSLPDDIKRQIAIDYLKKHPLSEDKQEAIAKEYIRKYGVIK